MFKSTHPITRIFWISLVVGVIIYQLNKTEYPGSDTYLVNVEVEHAPRLQADYEDEHPCVFPVIFFDTQSSSVNWEAANELEEVAFKLQNNPGMRLEISGTQSGREGNGLATSRERAIVSYLTRNFDIKANRLVTSNEDEEHFESPRGQQHSFNHHSNNIHNYSKPSCSQKKQQHYSYSYSYSCKKKVRTHCYKGKHHDREENRAVYLTCMD